MRVRCYIADKLALRRGIRRECQLRFHFGVLREGLRVVECNCGSSRIHSICALLQICQPVCHTVRIVQKEIRRIHKHSAIRRFGRDRESPQY